MNGQKIEIQLYVADIRDFSIQGGLDKITSKRQEQIKLYCQLEDKARCLTAGLMERVILKVESDEEIGFGENGKPYLKNSQTHYNIAHSGNYVVMAVSDVEVGVDIERIDEEALDAARICFTPLECNLVKENHTDKFFEIWTAKESIMKATGRGFTLLPESFTVLPLDRTAHEIEGRKWYFQWDRIEDHIFCTAVENYPQFVTISRFSIHSKTHSGN